MGISWLGVQNLGIFGYGFAGPGTIGIPALGVAGTYAVGGGLAFGSGAIAFGAGQTAPVVGLWAAQHPGLLNMVNQLGQAPGVALAPPGMPATRLCFAEGTMVLMADGLTKPIEDIGEGELVLTHDPQEATEPVARRVIQVHRTATYRLFVISIGGQEGGEIVATGSHPFWTQRGWIAAEDLKGEDVLTNDRGAAVPIRAIGVESRDARTFNLSIEGTHTFFVVAGRVPVLVHNVDPWDIMHSQQSYGPTFAEGTWAGRTLAEAADATRALGRLPNGLTLNVMELNNRWVTLNNRTLAVARMANLSQVVINDVGPSGLNKLTQLLRESDLVSPVENAVMRCK